MATTALAPFEAALLALLEDAEGLDGVKITGDLEPERFGNEYIWLYKRKAGPREFRTIGRNPAWVDEELRAYFRVLAIANKPSVAKARALQLAEAVEAAVRGGGLEQQVAELLMPLLVEEIEPEPVRFDRKAGFHVLMTVCCPQARV